MNDLSPDGLIIETLLRVADKEGNDVDFVLNDTQRKLDLSLTGRDLVPKARQEGVSTYVLGRFLSKCLRKRNTRAVVISHDQESTQRLLKRVQYFINNIRGPAPVIKNMSANEITFPKMDSMFYLGTAGSRKFGRGDTITDLHCSEYAYWPNAQVLMTGLLQAVPKTGEVIIESTGNGFNDYHNRCMRAASGNSMWALHFFPWHTFGEYVLELDEVEEKAILATLNADLEEDRLSEFLTPGQIAWRRMKLEELNYDIRAFKQEYPMTLDECFQASSESIFHVVNFKPSDRWEKRGRRFFGLKGHPRADLHYVFGCDVAGGVRKDASTIEIFCLETGEQVGEYSNNAIDPQAFAHTVLGIAKEWYDPYIVVEQNNHGILTLSTLSESYPAYLIHSAEGARTTDEEKALFDLGYKTTSRTKPLMIGRLRSLLVKDLTIYSTALRDQLSTFVEHENGKLEAQEGCFDDLVMAAACAVVGINPASMLADVEKEAEPTPKAPDPFSLDAIILEMQSRDKKFPISPQHAGPHGLVYPKLG